MLENYHEHVADGDADDAQLGEFGQYVGQTS